MNSVLTGYNHGYDCKDNLDMKKEKDVAFRGRSCDGRVKVSQLTDFI